MKSVTTTPQERNGRFYEIVMEASIGFQRVLIREFLPVWVCGEEVDEAGEKVRMLYLYDGIKLRDCPRIFGDGGC
ncbi:hypothetical protein SLA2020_461730 [Shorea laevis]